MRLNLNPRRPPSRSFAERHHVAIGVALSLVGFCTLGWIQVFGIKDSLATMTAGIGGFAVLFGWGFGTNRGPIFPASEITRQNRWKYLVLAGLLWSALFLIWWYRVKSLGR